jgi:hypothetical protein
MSYLQANPDVVANAQGKSDAVSQQINAAESLYGGVPAQLSSVFAQEQALVAKLKANPASVTPADMALASTLQSQEAALIGDATRLGAKITVANGQISMAPQ